MSLINDALRRASQNEKNRQQPLAPTATGMEAVPKAQGSPVNMILGIAVVVAFFWSRKLQRVITEPLDAMAVLARAIVTRRDYSLRVERTSDDEIGVVVDAFNNMLEEVDTRSRALESSLRHGAC